MYVSIKRNGFHQKETKFTLTNKNIPGLIREFVLLLSKMMQNKLVEDRPKIFHQAVNDQNVGKLKT